MHIIQQFAGDTFIISNQYEIMHVPDSEEVIEINESILKEFPAKKGDRHSVMSYGKIADAVRKANEKTDPYEVAATLLVASLW